MGEAAAADDDVEPPLAGVERGFDRGGVRGFRQKLGDVPSDQRLGLDPKQGAESPVVMSKPSRFVFDPDRDRQMFEQMVRPLPRRIEGAGLFDHPLLDDFVDDIAGSKADPPPQTGDEGGEGGRAVPIGRGKGAASVERLRRIGAGLLALGAGVRENHHPVVACRFAERANHRHAEPDRRIIGRRRGHQRRGPGRPKSVE